MPRPRAAYLAALLIFALSPGLAAQRPIPLDTVRVTAGSRLVGGAATVTRSVDVIDRRAIAALPATTVSDVIARALGVDLQPRSPAQADVSIRGSSFEQILVLVDGVPVNDHQTGHFHLDVAVPLDAVERVEILRGPAAAVYGSSAVGGVINIVTRGRSDTFTARAQTGSFGAWALGADAGTSRGDYAARISAGYDASDGHRDGTDHDIVQLRGSADAPLAGGSLSASAAWAARDFGANGFYAPFDSYEETRTATAALGWRSRPARLVIEPRFSIRRHEDDFILLRDNPAFYRNVHTTLQTAGELIARFQPSERLSLAAGGEASRADIESSSLGDREEDRLAAFIEAGIGSADRSLLSLGLRLDHHSAFGEFLSASAAAGHRISPTLRVRASAATGFRAPSWTDRYYVDPANIGSPDLDPERFWTAEVGTTLGSARGSLDLAAFIRHADDLIDWGRPATDPATTPWRTLNIESATFRGLEATGRTSLSGVRLTARGSLLSFDAEETPGFVSKYALQPLTRSASLEVGVPLADLADFGLRGTASRRADGESWQVLDARLSITVLGARIFADATNLLDDSWLDVSALPAPGRAFTVGARVRR